MKRVLVVVGHGMVGHRLVQEVRERDRADDWRVVVLAAESHAAYDRIALSAYARGADPTELVLDGASFTADDRVEVRRATPVTRIDRVAAAVVTADGARTPYDALVLATGARPFVPPVPGHDLPGCHVYRTLDDVAAIRERARSGRPAVVIGGGLLGVEAAGALAALGMFPEVVEAAPWLMAVQLDEGGGRLLGRLVDGLGVRPRCGIGLSSVDAGADGRVRSVTLADGQVVPADLVVFATGVRPCDELAVDADLPTGERGGFLVDARCRTPDPRVWAVGDCAAVEGRCHGLVAPGYRMAAMVARELCDDGDGGAFTDPDLSTKLKLLGVEVGSFGDAHARSEGAMEFIRSDRGGARYAKLVLDGETGALLGGVLAGDTAAYATLHSLLGSPLPGPPHELLDPACPL
ncbi:NAD(P)/FAD-dependent oxidoreductase [Streptomyces sp. NPDC098789]|uniref:NAD(P)/FAD-dependent oxidoreductase n=1 Tax=Streptomyces sp. NPDC098789 TaxID=3366098 RepID=UPI00382BB48D